MSVETKKIPCTTKTVKGLVFKLIVEYRKNSLIWFCPKTISTLRLTSAENEEFKKVGIVLWEPQPNPTPRAADQRWLEVQGQYHTAIKRDLSLALWYKQHKV